MQIKQESHSNSDKSKALISFFFLKKKAKVQIFPSGFKNDHIQPLFHFSNKILPLAKLKIPLFLIVIDAQRGKDNNNIPSVLRGKYAVLL